MIFENRIVRSGCVMVNYFAGVSLYAIVFPTRYSDIFTSFVSTPGYTNLDTFAAINLRTEPLRFRTGVCLQHLHEVGHLRYHPFSCSVGLKNSEHMLIRILSSSLLVASLILKIKELFFSPLLNLCYFLT